MKNKKIFLITIDTEADNQWDKESKISTENARFLPRFQELCEKYKYKPVYLTNYEMANDDFFVKYMKEKQEKGLCEIGMHLHAWNNPPEYQLKRINREKDYLIEYPEDIMKKKIKIITELIEKNFGVRPITHRSGRWATNIAYFDMLEEEGYKVDCSVTPHISWKNNLGSTGINGTDYSEYPEKPYYIKNKLLEVPMTIRKSHNFQKERIRKFKNLLGETKRYIQGRYQWMRPDKYLSKKGLNKIVKQCSKSNEYIMFMIHSSELMPGGSPNFVNENDIAKLYEVIDYIFDYAKKEGYEGMTLREYYNNFYLGGKDE